MPSGLGGNPGDLGTKMVVPYPLFRELIHVSLDHKHESTFSWLGLEFMVQGVDLT